MQLWIKVCTSRERICLLSKKEEYREKTLYFPVQNNSSSEARQKIRHKRRGSGGGTAEHLCLSGRPWEACSMSRLRPFLQAVCQGGRGSLEWDREVALKRERLSRGNKRKARAKRRNRDAEPRRWTMFSICTHLHEKRRRGSHQFR